MLEYLFSEAFLLSCVTAALPILFAGFAALISNKVGLLNINIEGSMSVAAVTGALVSHYTASWAVGLLAALAAGVVMSLILFAAARRLGTDSVLTGIALNTFATGFCVFLLYSVLGVKGDSSGAPSVQIPSLFIPWLSEIPVLGKLLFGQNLLFYVAIACLVLLTLLLNRTRTGAYLRATGYHEEAARSVGIDPERQRMKALILCGIFCGLGGAYLSMAGLSYFSAGMVGGRGFIGVAAEAMGAGIPWLTALFSFLFGVVDSFALGSQAVLGAEYYELLNTLPYVMTLLALIAYAVIDRARKAGADKPKIIRSEEDSNEKGMATGT